MQNTVDYRVSVHELFSFEPFIECYCLAGWSGKDKIITEITEIRQLDDRLEPGTLMAINLSSIDANHPSLKINSSLSGILLFGSSLPSLPTGLIEKAERYKIPLIHTPIEDGFLEAKSLWDFIEDLKKRNKFLHFARSSFYYSIDRKSVV